MFFGMGFINSAYIDNVANQIVKSVETQIAAYSSYTGSSSTNNNSRSTYPLMPSFSGSIFSSTPFYYPVSAGASFASLLFNYYNPFASNFSASSSTTASEESSRTTSSSAVSSGTAASSSRSGSGTNVQKQNSSFWSRLGYCAESGVRLAKNALRAAGRFRHRCATYVKNAISRCGMGKYEKGNACDTVYILRRNRKFREINPTGVDVRKLPAGCVVVYGKGVPGYDPNCGHVEIATGDGRGVSDGITQYPKANPTAIFVPVSA